MTTVSIEKDTNIEMRNVTTGVMTVEIITMGAMTNGIVMIGVTANATAMMTVMTGVMTREVNTTAQKIKKRVVKEMIPTKTMTITEGRKKLVAGYVKLNGC